MEHFNGIPSHMSGPANKQHINHHHQYRSLACKLLVKVHVKLEKIEGIFYQDISEKLLNHHFVNVSEPYFEHLLVI